MKFLTISKSANITAIVCIPFLVHSLVAVQVYIYKAVFLVSVAVSVIQNLLDGSIDRITG